MSTKEFKAKFTADNKDLNSKMSKSQSSISSWAKKVGGLIAGVFAVRYIVNFGKEIIKLASGVQGVKIAFDRLNKPALLNDLRKATRGTVTDLELMQKAVQAKNFKIPLEQLATYFEFATKRAIQTGESVDYLVNSIITGIGRKSVLVMDNLGISAVELQEEVKRVGDFGIASGNIIRRELKSMGTVTDTTAIKTAQLAAAWTNFKVFLGSKLTPVYSKLLSIGVSVFKSMTKESATLREEQAEVNVLVSSITNENTSREVRRKLIEELQSKYPDFLKNLDVEKTTNEDLKTALTDINKQYEEKIRLAVQQELVNRKVKDFADSISKEAKLTKNLTSEKKALAKATDPMDIKILSAAIEHNNKQIKKEQDYRQGLNDEINESIKLLIVYKKIVELSDDPIKEQFKTIDERREAIKALTESLGKLKDGEGERAEQIKQQIIYLQTLIDKILEYSTAIERIPPPDITTPDLAPKIDSSELQKYSGEIEGLGNVSAGVFETISAKAADLNDTWGDYAMAASSSFKTVGDLFEAQKQKELSAVGDNAEKRAAIEKKYLKKQKALSISQALINGAVGVTKAFAQGGILGFVTGGLVAAATAAQVAIINAQAFAAGGGAYGPTLAMVGEAPGISRSNPEYIGTAAQLSQMGVGGGGQLSARISRGDLLFILNEGKSYNSNNY